MAKFKASDENTYIPERRDQTFRMRLRQWGYLKEDVNGIPEGLDWWQLITSFLFGTFTTLLGVTISTKVNKGIFWTLTGFSLVIFLLTLLFVRSLGTMQKGSKKLVQRRIKEIENEHKMPEQ